MAAIHWVEATRGELTELSLDSVVVVPLGSTEQHGTHLVTGTDAQLVEAVCVSAVAMPSPVRYVLAPTMTYGASDHHLPFGGTLSLRAETLFAVLTDVLRSISIAGFHRAVLVNGHGGNTAIAKTAAAAWSTQSDLVVGTLDYWDLLPDGATALPVPGHAGAFETSLAAGLRPERVRQPVSPPSAEDPPDHQVGELTVHSGVFWEKIDGCTDDPVQYSAERGAELMTTLSEALADRLARFAALPTG